MRRRGRIGRGFEIVAEHGADCGLVAFVDTHLLDDGRPEAAAAAFEQVCQRARLGLEALRTLLGLRQRPACPRLRFAGLRQRGFRGGSALLGSAGVGGLRGECIAQRRHVRRFAFARYQREFGVDAGELGLAAGEPLARLDECRFKRRALCLGVGEFALRLGERGLGAGEGLA